MKCPSCQTAVSDDSHFCSKCGASLKGEAQTRTIQGPAPMLKKGQIIAGKYRIIQKIGEGGMGVVYKAQDTKLDRPVALKFLPSEMTRDPASKKRFIQEAKAAAGLSHSNITVVYEIVEDKGQTFIAMEFIEGQTLRDKIESGPLGIEEAIGIASQVAEGLKEAHDKGIIHRDIKPANIMLTKNGQAKIMDFGLAKLSWGIDLTRPSMIMGTVAYMSPEQARGETVDHRTDIWSLGAMLFEMLSGEKPFQKSHDQALIHSILNDEPKRISDTRSDVPGYLEKVITKALDKNADRRFQNAEEMFQELKQSPSVISREANKSIVVLPFENLSSDPEQEYFSDGLTEEIISDLSQVQELLVISRSSAMTFKGTKKKIKEIGRELNVQYALEGSVRKSGNKLRITAQLIQTDSDRHLWAEKYNGVLDDVFDIQESVSRSIVDALKIRLSPEESQSIKERPIDNVLAYECYLKAKHEIMAFTKEGVNRALEHLQTGLRIVGENALILRGIGFARFQQLNIGISSDRTLVAEIEANAKRILKWNPESPHGYFLYGCIGVLKGDFVEAVKYWRRAYEIDPHDPETMLLLGAHSLSTGQPEFSRQLIEKLLLIDPLVPLNQIMISYTDLYMGRPADNLEMLRKAVEKGADIPILMFAAVRVLAASGETGEAFSVAEHLNKSHPKTMISHLAMALAMAVRGHKEEARNLLTDELYDLARYDCEWATSLIECNALVGDTTKALDLLENAVAGGLLNYPFLSEYDPFLENIRSEPRFKKLMERVKHEWEYFEV